MNKHETVSSLDGLPDEYVLTPKELAAILRVNRSKVSEMLSTGEIEGLFRVGRLQRILTRDVRKWIAAERLPRSSRIAEIHEEARRRCRRTGKGFTY